MGGQHVCDVCGSSFSKKSLLLEHRRILGHRQSFSCHICNKHFVRKDNLDRHLLRHNDGSLYECGDCRMLFSREDSLQRHRQQQHPQIGGGNGIVKEMSNTVESETDEDTSNLYNIRIIEENYLPKFQTKATNYKIDFKDINVRGLPHVMKTLKSLFDSIIKNLTEFMEETDLVRMSLQCPELDFPISLQFMQVNQLTAERVLREIERVLQSYEQFVLDDSLEIEVIHVHLPDGGVGKRCRYIDLNKMMKDKKCFIRIQNDDDLCFARALITAQARIEGHPSWNSIRQGRKIQEVMAKALHDKAQVPYKKCGIPEMKRFQEVMPEYQINVISKETFNSLIFVGPDAQNSIYLYHHDEHYDVITSMPAFLGRNYFCSRCKKGYDHEERHVCNNPCYHCHHIHDDDSKDWMHCADCNRYFLNTTCFELHKKTSQSESSTCTNYYRCKNCDKSINLTIHKKPHVCGERYCKRCKDFVPDDHQCYMQVVHDDNHTFIKNNPRDKKAENKTYCFFDFECTQDTMIQCEKGYDPCKGKRKCQNCKRSTCGSFEHRPNLCVAHKVCEKCMHENVSPNSTCERCGNNEVVFKGNNAVEEFCQWLFSEANYGCKVFCHNFKGYDSYPILSYLHKNAILPEVVTNGSKYLSIDVPQCKIRFLDSINFLPMPLAELPEAFDIEELAKGYFPHFYNSAENQNATLNHLPDVYYYNPDGMKPDKRETFLQWYELHKNDRFDFQHELQKYCRSDVDILRKSCLKFRELFMKMTVKENQGIDPFDSCITIASACNLVFRTNFLQHESIGIIPPQGYRPEDKQSSMALSWLSYIAKRDGINIRHAKNMGEKQIGPYKVDGYAQMPSGEKCVWEFHGCFWHGCPKCYSRETINPVTDCTMEDLHMNTLDKKKFLKDNGYQYVCIWECDFKKDCKENTSMKTYIDSLEMETPLEPRDAFYGGRTEAFTLFHSAKENEQIKYYDVTSLYPFVNKTGKIPLGHPDIITDNFKDVREYEGLVKCKVVPPRDLYIPVLPWKCNNKLIFSLCRTCAQSHYNGRCVHSDDERAITGTWVTDELKKAMGKGYKMSTIYEVWHFTDVAHYDPVKKSGGIFTEYVNTFLKLKQESSGWPKWCTTSALKQQYIQDYYEKEGIMLDPDNIAKNGGMRRLAKLMLNSFWGKFGQRTNLIQSTYITDPTVYFEMLTSDKQVVKNMRIISSEMVELNWSYDDDFLETSGRTNVVIAAYTTAHARMKLYSYLERLEARTLYCDTDSVVFISRPGLWEPELGDYLGDMTDEIEAENTITNFVTGGPKNYAYELLNQDSKGNKSYCKVRGITLNYKNAIDVNYDTLKNMVKSDENLVVTVTDNHKICRDKASCKIISKPENKDYRIVFDKRVLVDGIHSIPYGM